MLFLLLVAVACAAEPESIEITVEVPVEVPVELPVEVTVEVPLEVTRIVKEVAEVEVTRLVEVEVDVTRIVTQEKIVTATPTTTVENLPTPAPIVQATSPPTSVRDSLLLSMQTMRDALRDLGWMLDSAINLTAERVVAINDLIVASPEYDVTNEDALVQTAYANYRLAIVTFASGSRDLILHARDFIARGETCSVIPQIQCGLARIAIDDALVMIGSGIDSMEQQ